MLANANITKVDYDKIEGFEVVSNNEENFTFTDTFTGTDEKEYDDILELAKEENKQSKTQYIQIVMQ